MVTSVTLETILIFDNVTFYNNDFGDETVKVNISSLSWISWCCSFSHLCHMLPFPKDHTVAIFSGGPLTVRNTCFVQNSFSRDAPIVSIGGSDMEVSSTFIDVVDPDLGCSLAAAFNNQSDWALGRVGTCIDSDVGECQSTIDLNPVTPSPGVGSIGPSFPQGNFSPASMPTRAPVTGVGNEGGSSPGSPASIGSFTGVTTLATIFVLSWHVLFAICC